MRVTAASGADLGYVRATSLGYFGIYAVTEDAAAALLVAPPPSTGGPFDLAATNAPTRYPRVGFSVGYYSSSDDLAAGSSNYQYMGGVAPTAPGRLRPGQQRIVQLQGEHRVGGVAPQPVRRAVGAVGQQRRLQARLHVRVHPGPAVPRGGVAAFTRVYGGVGVALTLQQPPKAAAAGRRLLSEASNSTATGGFESTFPVPVAVP